MISAAQLCLEIPEPIVGDGKPDDGLWTYHRGLPFREGMHRYTHLVWGQDDPAETRGRGARAIETGERPTGWWKAIGGPEEWAEKILAHMQDGKPRTFNRICVELTGATANVFFEKGPDVALWLLVERELLWWTAEAPIYFIHRDALTFDGEP